MVATQPRRDEKVIHRLRVPEYLRLAEMPAWPRTELLEGVIYDMPSESRLHADAVHALLLALIAHFPSDRVRATGSLVAGEYSMPEPDLYVERARATATSQYTLADDLILVVEVSVTTLSTDEGIKRAIYAEAEVPEYWVVVPRGATSYLLRHTGPDPDKRAYASIERIELPNGVEGIDVAAIRA